MDSRSAGGAGGEQSELLFQFHCMDSESTPIVSPVPTVVLSIPLYGFDGKRGKEKPTIHETFNSIVWIHTAPEVGVEPGEH